MKRTLHGTRILITGASSGIGAALAIEFAKHNLNIVLMARRKERLETIQNEVEKLGSSAVAVVGDVTNPSHRANAITTCLQDFGGLDILVNNAGIGAVGPFSQAQPERLRTIMDVNFIAPVELTRLALPLLRESEGAIVNINSVLGHRAVPNKSEYCASKFALHGFSDAIRAEVASAGINVTLISPSTVESDFFDSVIDGRPTTRRRGISPIKVAKATIRAIQRRQSEVILPLEGKLLVLIDRLWPSLANRLVAQRRSSTPRSDS